MEVLYRRMTGQRFWWPQLRRTASSLLREGLNVIMEGDAFFMLTLASHWN